MNQITKHKNELQRAEYGKKIVVTLSRQLVAKYGKSFEDKNLRRHQQETVQ
jgi:hypothetical protein